MKENIRRQSTWVSATEIQLLWITVQDYAEIYNLDNSELLHDPGEEDQDEDEKSDEVKLSKIEQFVGHLPHFEDWPVEELNKHVTRHCYQLFNRNDVIVPHTCQSNQLFFVIEGTLSVVKRLPLPEITDRKKNKYTGGSRRGLLKTKIAEQLNAFEPWMGETYRQMRLAYRLGTMGKLQQLKSDEPEIFKSDTTIMRIQRYLDPESYIRMKSSIPSTKSRPSVGKSTRASKSAKTIRSTVFNFDDADKVFDDGAGNSYDSSSSDDNENDDNAAERRERFRQISKRIAMFSGFLPSNKKKETAQQHLESQKIRRKSSRTFSQLSATSPIIVNKDPFSYLEKKRFLSVDSMGGEESPNALAQNIDFSGLQWLSAEGLKLVRSRRTIDNDALRKLSEAKFRNYQPVGFSPQVNVVLETIEKGGFFVSGLLSFFNLLILLKRSYLFPFQLLGFGFSVSFKTTRLYVGFSKRCRSIGYGS